MNILKVIALVQSYLLNSKGQTIKFLSSMLCFDLSISYRSAREDYIMPLVYKKVLIRITDISNYYVFNPKCIISKKGYIEFKTDKEIQDN